MNNLPFDISLIDAITIIAGLAVFVSVFAVWSTLLVRDPMRGRIRSLQARREELREGLVATRKRQSPIKKIDHVSLMRKVVDYLKLTQKSQSKRITIKLARAGFRQKDAIIIYLFAKFVLPILAAIVASTLIFGVNFLGPDLLQQAAFGFGSIGVAFYAPEVFIKNTTDKRYEAIRKTLPDALDLLVICAEAGLTLDAALKRVSREMASASAELADELSLTAIELGFLTNRRQALANLADRVDLKAIGSVVTTLVQTEKYGTPLSQSLRILSGEFRTQRMMAAEEKAARLPAIMTVPLILFILPVLFIVLLGPAACSVADNIINRGF